MYPFAHVPRRGQGTHVVLATCGVPFVLHRGVRGAPDRVTKYSPTPTASIPISPGTRLLFQRGLEGSGFRPKDFGLGGSVDIGAIEIFLGVCEGVSDGLPPKGFRAFPGSGEGVRLNSPESESSASLAGDRFGGVATGFAGDGGRFVLVPMEDLRRDEAEGRLETTAPVFEALRASELIERAVDVRPRTEVAFDDVDMRATGPCLPKCFSHISTSSAFFI